VDRLFDWHAVPDTPIQEALARQKPHVRAEFDQRLKQSTLNLNEQGLNVALHRGTSRGMRGAPSRLLNHPWGWSVMMQSMCGACVGACGLEAGRLSLL